MKYTEKSPNFQRAEMLLIRSMLIMVGCTMVAHAQEVVWPVPAAAPEQFVGAQLQLDGFEQYYDPFRALTIYGMDRRGSGTALAKLTAGQRGSIDGFQAELEWYPMVGTRSYAYVGYAFGFDAPFPRHRGGAEYFVALPAALEASLGFRVFDFRDRRTVKLLTGSAAMYVGNMWFSVRPYISVDLPRTAFSVMATGRYYYGERDDFAFVRLGAGFTPDERTSLTTSGLPATEVFTLHSQTLGLGGQWLAGSGLLLTIEATYGRQEVGFRRGTYISSSSVILGARYAVR